MSCQRCTLDPQPSYFGSPRLCAFDSEGNFTPENWNCATIDTLIEACQVRDLPGSRGIDGDDESMQPCYAGHYGGWIVLTRYKGRGCTSSAVHIGDFFPPQTVTLALVERFIRREEAEWDDEANPSPTGRVGTTKANTENPDVE